MALVFSFHSLAARQYIQCRLASFPSDPSGIVLNLDGEESTALMTNGLMDTGEILITLKKLSEKSETETTKVFVSGKTLIRGGGPSTEEYIIEKKDLGIRTNYLEIKMKQSDVRGDREYDLSCFSNIFEL